ncbi:phosphoribosylpyrophosphate synthetase [Spirosoma sp. KNUC1025]|uniref:phosphoribosylpyrophosphate synthetase n=1 Tax=Spirosoma sp. KNUC1025 TaxID=2894082 RepID=UPI0038659BB1|nr:phosphoribosylpyrophosphate synthetase [Spirosoma sp. KNUC1025]
MQTYDTVTEALEGLKKQGFILDYNLKPDRLHCESKNIELSPADFDIVDVFRFEGMTDPGDETVVYAVEATNGDKGTLVDAYGTYSEAISPEMAEKLRYTPEG